MCETELRSCTYFLWYVIVSLLVSYFIAIMLYYARDYYIILFVLSKVGKYSCLRLRFFLSRWELE